MRETKPAVFLVARPSVDVEAMRAYLEDVGGAGWLDRRLGDAGAGGDAELLVEFGGRLCYRSWEPGLNANVTRIRHAQEEYFENLLRSAHGSVLEHASYSFAFRNVSRVFCYDAETEVLTSTGWKRWPEVDGSECFGTLNPETDELEYQHADEHFVGDYDGPMYRVRSEQVDLLVTPQHRMWVQRGEQPFGVEHAEAIEGHSVRYQKAGHWSGQESGVVELPEATASGKGRTVSTVTAALFPLRAFARFLGRYLAEGSLHRDDIVLTEDRDSGRGGLTEAVRDLGLTPSRRRGEVRITSVALRDFLADSLDRSHQKTIPAVVHDWGRETLREFLTAFAGGLAETVIRTGSRAMADDLQVLAIKAGWSANIRTESRDANLVSLDPGDARPVVNHGSTKPHDSRVPYRGRVYCVKVPNGLLFVRRNGKPVVSGNTHELVRHRAGSAFSQESLRYVRLTDIGFRVPPALEPIRDQVISLVEQLEEFQVDAADRLGIDEDGLPFAVKKEITSALRRLAPIGLSTDILWTANVRTLRHVIEMRTAPGAEEELRSVFDTVAVTMKAEAPALFQDFERAEDGAWVPRHRKV